MKGQKWFGKVNGYLQRICRSRTEKLWMHHARNRQQRASQQRAMAYQSRTKIDEGRRTTDEADFGREIFALRLLRSDFFQARVYTLATDELAFCLTGKSHPVSLAMIDTFPFESGDDLRSMSHAQTCITNGASPVSFFHISTNSSSTRTIYFSDHTWLFSDAASAPISGTPALWI